MFFFHAQSLATPFFIKSYTDIINIKRGSEACAELSKAADAL